MEIRIINSSQTLVIKVLLDIHYHLLVNIHITNNLSRVNDKANNLNPGESVGVPSENYRSFYNHSNSHLLKMTAAQVVETTVIFREPHPDHDTLQLQYEEFITDIHVYSISHFIF